MEGFGGLGPLSLSFAPGLNLILGPNEAGKTCLMEFIRAALFGLVKRDGAYQRYLPLDGRPYGGRVVVEEDGGRELVLVARFPGLPRLEGKGEGEWIFPRETGALLYSRVFSLGLAQVSNLTLLSGEEMAQHLYSTALGPLGKAYARAVEELERRREDLFKAKGQKPLINQLVREIKSVDGELSRLKALPSRYEELLRELKALEGELERVTEEWARVRRERKEWDILARAHPLFSQLEEIQRLLEGEGLPSSFPPQGLERLGTLEKELEQLEGELEEVRLLLEPVEKALAQPFQGGEVLSREGEIMAIREEWALIKEKRRRLLEVDGHLSVLDGKIKEGMDYLELNSLPPRPTGVVWERLKGFMEGFSTLDKERLALEKELELREEERERRESELETLRGMAPQKPPLPRDEVMTRQEFVSQAKEHILAAPSFWQMAVSFFFLLLGGVGVWVGGHYGWPLLKWGGSAVALVGMAGLATAWFRRGKWMVEARRLGRRLDLKDFTFFALDGLSKNLKEMEDAWKEVDRWRMKCSDVERALGMVARGMERIRGALESLKAREQTFKEEWEEWMGELGLPPVSSPQGTQELLHRLEELHRFYQERELLSQEREKLAQVVGDFGRRLEGLLAELGIEFNSLEEGMVALTGALKGAWEEEEKRGALEAKAGPLREKARLLEDRLKKKRGEMEALLRDGGVASLQQFREKAQKWERREALEEEARGLRLQLAALLGGNWEDWAPRLADLAPGEAGKRAEELGEREQELGRRRDGIIEARTRLQKEKEELEGEDREQELAQRREELLDRLRDAVEKWTVDTLALVLFRRTREVYERENQPRVLHEASHFFSTMTNGRYVRIFLPMGVRELWVERRDGQRLSSRFLSRGTGEQLYLSLSMAIMLEVAERGMAFPVVLDDILVNFDPERASRAARAIQHLSSKLQVLFFTCHPHVKGLLASVEGVTVRTLSLSTDS